MSIPTLDLAPSYYAEEILSGIPFSFPRFGDGDWRA
ncbi:unnamed protein product, partial [marine sediment metagenome]